MGSIAVSLTGTNTGHSTAWLEYTESNINADRCDAPNQTLGNRARQCIKQIQEIHMFTP